MLTVVLCIAFVIVVILVIAWLVWEIRADRRDQEAQDDYRKWLRETDPDNRWPPRGDV
jgi:heme/copper-type cytochrome/quinol oxidase subunit 2